MTKLGQEAADLIDALPPEKAREVLDFARYLSDRASDEAWEKSFSNPRAAARLRKYADEAMKEYKAGKTKPLIPEKL